MYGNKKPLCRIKFRKDWFIWCLIFTGLAAIAAGSVGDSAIKKEVVESEVASLTDSDKSSGSIQSISFKKDMDIRDALHFLSARYQKNIVPSPGVTGRLAFTSLFDVTFEEAMDAILGGKFEYEQKGNLIEVYQTGDVSRMKYAVFALDYITAAEAKRLIAPVLSSKGVVGETSAAETGVPTGESISAQTGGGDTMSLKDTIVVYDYAENIKRSKELIDAVDTRPKQVLIEATILSATLTEDTQFGIDWQTLKGTAVTELAGISTGAPDYFKSDGVQLGGATKVSGGLTVGLALGDVGSFIRAVEQITDVTILANPKILAVNKQLGQVYIGTKVGYREGDIETTGGGIQEGAVKFLDTGTKLSFRPYISSEGYIRMDIHAKDSTDESSGGIPSESSTELVSNIMVKDGQMIVIGGLFHDRVDTKKSQIPVLGDLPIVGGVFRGTADNYVRKEVMVLLVPHVIEEPAEAEGIARAEDVNRKRFGAKEQMQWIGRTRLVEDRYAKAAKYYIAGDNEAALNELETVLELYPAYLEAIRLKERIIGEINPDEAEKMERVILKDIEREDTGKWLRR